MIIDSHMHLIRKKNFDKVTYERLGMKVPEDTPLDQLVGWMKEAGVKKAVAMGQDMTRIWKTTFGEEYLLEAYKRYPDFFIPLASVEPIDEANRFHKANFEYFQKAVNEYGFRGVLMTPPYGQFHSNDKTVYPFYEFAQEKGVVVQFHHSAQMGPAILAPTKYASMFNLNDIIIDFPNLTFIVEHLGYPWSEHLFVLMTNDKNLWTDLAMTYERQIWVTWNLVLAKQYGVLDRVMYASDYVAYSYDLYSANPANDFKRWINFVKTGINEICKSCGWPLFTQEEIDGFLWKNAARLYHISVEN
ncbi:MAG: amidohydrolase family protein [Candidatus Atribacteria bacterium]|nr:amidohydrolase family protein [Candidatus Atribacteria bacterium]